MGHFIFITVGRRVAGLALGAVLLWQVAEHAGPSRGRVLVHVSSLPADLVVDQNVYHLDSLEETPIICELRPGRHVARMIREDRVVYQEEFAVSAGEEVILSAWDQYVDGRSPGRVSEAATRTADGSAHRGAAEPPRPAIGVTGPLATARRRRLTHERRERSGQAPGLHDSGG
ncbi:MAG: hypothetical protein ACYC61_25905 [Isosphaeraceae bacterium]